MGRKLIVGLFAIVIAASFVFISGDVIAADKKRRPQPSFLVFWPTGPAPLQRAAADLAVVWKTIWN